MRRSQCVRVSLLVNVITFVVMDLGLEPQVCKFNFRKAGALWQARLRVVPIFPQR